MIWSTTCQPERAVEASPFRSSGFAVRWQARVRISGQATGFVSRFAPIHTWAHRDEIREQLEVFRHVHNACVVADRAGRLDSLKVPEGEMAQAAIDHYRECRAKAFDSLRIYNVRSIRYISAVGPLRALMFASIHGAEVIPASITPNPGRRTYTHLIVEQAEPVAKVSRGRFLAEHPLPSNASDLGLAVLADDLHVSEMTIRGARRSEDLRPGKNPTYFLFSLAEVLTSGFAAKFSDLLISMRVKLRVQERGRSDHPP